MSDMRINFRTRAAQEMLADLDMRSVLDVGCRSCEVREVIAPEVEYFGCDLIQNASGTVTFVGDAMTLDFGRRFDCVIALDVIEHVDDPHSLMRKLITLAENHLLVSLPNVYDVQHMINFVLHQSMGEKYSFSVNKMADRHRWVMNYDEIQAFYEYFARECGLDLTTRDLWVGLNAARFKWKALCTLLRPVIGKKHLTGTVMGLFCRAR